jgi:hypothetical protein
MGETAKAAKRLPIETMAATRLGEIMAIQTFPAFKIRRDDRHAAPEKSRWRGRLAQQNLRAERFWGLDWNNGYAAPIGRMRRPRLDNKPALVSSGRRLGCRPDRPAKGIRCGLPVTLASQFRSCARNCKRLVLFRQATGIFRKSFRTELSRRFWEGEQG